MPKLVLKAPAVGHALALRVTLPAGTYKMVNYSTTGTYYAAPEPVTIRGWAGTTSGSGGIHIPNDPATGKFSFYANNNGQRIQDTLDAPPDYVIEP